MYFPASLGDEFLYRNRPSAKFVALTGFLQVRTPNWSNDDKTRSHRSICQFNFYNSHSISPKLLKSVKPYNSANPSPLDQHVFEGRRSHRSIALFTFYEFCKLFLKSVENEIPCTTAHTRCQKKTSLGEANLIVLYGIPAFFHAF